MGNSTEKTISRLKHLLSICNDGKEGYKNAADNVKSAELKSVFNKYSIQRSEFAVELKTLLRQYKVEPGNEEGGPLGVIHRTWIDIKSALTGKDENAILNACITGEKAAVNAYDEALRDDDLHWEMQKKLTPQRQSIADALTTIENLAKHYQS